MSANTIENLTEFISTKSHKLLLLDQEELAQELRMGLRTVQRHTAEGHLPHFRLGNRVLYDWNEVLEAIRQN